MEVLAGVDMSPRQSQEPMGHMVMFHDYFPAYRTDPQETLDKGIPHNSAAK